MAIWKHRLSKKNIELEKADCLTCGKNIRIVKTGKSWKCLSSRREQRENRSSKSKWFRESLLYRPFFKDREIYICNKCKCQDTDIRFFDIDHLDSNHKNNNLSNLQILCPSCHRRKTIQLWNSLKK